MDHSDYVQQAVPFLVWPGGGGGDGPPCSIPNRPPHQRDML